MRAQAGPAQRPASRGVNPPLDARIGRDRVLDGPEEDFPIGRASATRRIFPVVMFTREE